MLPYLEKFNNLPAEIRNKISSPEAMAAISDLESRYNVSLAAVIMRIMVKDISILDLEKYFVFEYNLDGTQARELVKELKDRVFVSVADYLGISQEREESTEDGGEKLDGWMNERRGETAVHSSDFFFSTEDEEEVNKLAEKVQEFTGAEPRINNALEIADQAVKKLDYNFSSEELSDRFGKILMTYIKGVRNKLDTKQTLLKPIEEGGLGLNDVLAGKALAISDKIKEEFIEKEKTETIRETSRENEKEESKALKSETKEDFSADSGDLTQSVFPPERQAVPVRAEAEAPGASEYIEKDKEKTIDSLSGGGDRDMDYDYSALEKRGKKSENQELRDEKKTEASEPQALNLRTASADEKKQPLRDEKKIKREAVLDLTEHENKTKDSTSVFNVKRAIKKAGKEDKSGKIKMEDIKHVPKLSGPIDELKEMDLEHFRRLEEDSGAAAGKIKEKISFLEEDGYDKKLAGVKAWRQSQLNKLYLQIGQEAIRGKKGIGSVIEERQSAGNDCLTEIEFEAIMELNKKLRF